MKYQPTLGTALYIYQIVKGVFPEAVANAKVNSSRRYQICAHSSDGIECLATNEEVAGSSPAGRAIGNLAVRKSQMHMRCTGR